jgi:hypothetical protein
LKEFLREGRDSFFEFAWWRKRDLKLNTLEEAVSLLRYAASKKQVSALNETGTIEPYEHTTYRSVAGKGLIILHTQT